MFQPIWVNVPKEDMKAAVTALHTNLQNLYEELARVTEELYLRIEELEETHDNT